MCDNSMRRFPNDDWKNVGIPCQVDKFGTFEPVQILYECDGPRIFTVENQDGNLMLAYLCDEEDDVFYFLVVPTTNQMVEVLLSGKKTVHEVLSQPWVWLLKQPCGGPIRKASSLDASSIPEDVLPQPWVYLDSVHSTGV